LYRGIALVMPHRPCIGALRWSCRTALVSGHCAGHAAPPLYRGIALVMPRRPCIGGSALVIGGASVYRGLCVVEKCQIFLQGIKRSELLTPRFLFGAISLDFDHRFA
jgi:hypothetical protein